MSYSKYINKEYINIKEILSREPNYVELGIYSVMWSEHCSYKSSIKMLKTLPRSGGRLLVDAGEENAGMVDLGDNLAFDRSMRNFYAMPNTQIPNAQKKFGEFCYGDMPSCKEGNGDQCVANTHERLNGRSIMPNIYY